ncbi:MAG: alpha/beta hydrolase [Gammaproteobacteria bacterium]
MTIRKYVSIFLTLLSISFMLLACTGVVFQPDNIEYIDLEVNHVIYKDVYFNTENNIKLHGWFLPSREPVAKGTILFLHGNAQNISSHINSVFWLPYSGFNVFLFDYQGYGKSEGQPTLSGVQKDFHAALDWLFQKKSIDNQKIIVFGQSLGAAIALNALSESEHKNMIRGMIADSSFTSYRNITRDVLDNFWLTWAIQWPLSFTVSDDYPPIEAIPKISPVPVLIMHSKNDEIIPYSHGLALYQAANNPKLFWSSEKIKHIQIFSIEENRQLFVQYLNSMLNNTFPVLNSK